MTRTALGLALLMVAALPAAAQIPDEFTNLMVLPKEIGKRELVSVMREYSGALGVRCNFCHVGESTESLEGYDFASDKTEHKRVARAMMNMTRQINDRLLPNAGLESPVQVRCVTCHRGVKEPEGLDRILLSTMDEGGADAAAKRYRELREEYYGSGSYNFGAGTLNKVAETAAEGGDLDGAIALVQLNLEANPDGAAYGNLMLAQLYAMQGDKTAAVAAAERCLELEPDNRRARRMLEQLRSSE